MPARGARRSTPWCPPGVKKQAGTRMGTFLVVPEETRAKLAEIAATLTPAKQAEVLAVLAQVGRPLTVSDLCRLAEMRARHDRRIAAKGG